MPWKTVAGAVATVVCAIVVLVWRHRRPAPPKLGAVSTSWIAEHQSGVDS